MLNSLFLCSINGKQSLDDSTSVYNTISKYFEYTVKTYSSEKKKKILSKYHLSFTTHVSPMSSSVDVQ